MAENKLKQQGKKVPDLTYSASGFVFGQGPSALVGGLKTSATMNSIPGEYAITIGTLSASNYDITFSPGVLTVNAGVIVDLDATDAYNGQEVPESDELDFGMVVADQETTPSATIIARDTGYANYLRILRWDPSVLSLNYNSNNQTTGELHLPSMGDVTISVTSLRPIQDNESIKISMEVIQSDSDGNHLFQEVAIKVVSGKFVVTQIEFTSDHNMIRSNKTSYSTSGDRYNDVEWKRVEVPGFPGQKAFYSAPITQTANKKLTANVTLDTSAMKKGIKCNLIAITSNLGFRLISDTFVTDGNASMKISVAATRAITSTGADNVSFKPFQKMIASIEWRVLPLDAAGSEIPDSDGNSIYFNSGSSLHTAYTTLGTPLKQSDPNYQITDVRMDRAIIVAARAFENALTANGNANPTPFRLAFELIQLHKFNVNVSHLYYRGGAYDIANAWRVPENWDTPISDSSPVEKERREIGSDCISGATFTGFVASALGLKGDFETQLVIPAGTTPAKSLQSATGALFDNDGKNPKYTSIINGKSVGAILVDGKGNKNNFEATIAFTSNNRTIYLASGVPGAVFDSRDSVLRTFTVYMWVDVTTKKPAGIIFDYDNFGKTNDLAYAILD